MASECGIYLEAVTLPEDQAYRMAFVLHNVLSKKECVKYIKMTEERGYEKALVNIGGGRQLEIADVRNSFRCIIDSAVDAEMLWQKIKEYVPSIWYGYEVLGLNERLRFLRYDQGQYFKPHYDGQYVGPAGERSFITVQLYLNEGFQGGSTTFLPISSKLDQRMEVVPKAGSVLVFEHQIMHEGSLLKAGRKYAMRTDVMYRKINTE